MSITQTSATAATGWQPLPAARFRSEVVVIPVVEHDRADRLAPRRVAAAHQPLTQRPGVLPGRGAGRARQLRSHDPLRADLLHETAEYHDTFEQVARAHDWWDWYAAYMTSREAGDDAEHASEAAARYMGEAK